MAGPAQQNIFAEMDKDKNAKLDAAELLAWLDNDEGKVAGVLRSEDKDGDGAISFAEFSGPKGVEGGTLENIRCQVRVKKETREAKYSHCSDEEKAYSQEVASLALEDVLKRMGELTEQLRDDDSGGVETDAEKDLATNWLMQKLNLLTQTIKRKEMEFREGTSPEATATEDAGRAKQRGRPSARA